MRFKIDIFLAVGLNQQYRFIFPQKQKKKTKKKIWTIGLIQQPEKVNTLHSSFYLDWCYPVIRTVELYIYIYLNFKVSNNYIVW